MTRVLDVPKVLIKSVDVDVDADAAQFRSVSELTNRTPAENEEEQDEGIDSLKPKQADLDDHKLGTI